MCIQTAAEGLINKKANLETELAEAHYSLKLLERQVFSVSAPQPDINAPRLQRRPEIRLRLLQCARRIVTKNLGVDARCQSHVR